MKIKSNTFNSLTFWSIIVLIALFFNQDVQANYQPTSSQQTERTEEGSEREIQEFVSISSVKTKRLIEKKTSQKVAIHFIAKSFSSSVEGVRPPSQSLIISYCVFRI